MRSSRLATALAAIIYGVAGIAWTILELTPQGLGYPDTDDPAMSLRYLADHSDVYRQAGLALILMALALIVVVQGVTDVLRRSPSATDARPAGSGVDLAIRSVTTIGLFAAAALLIFGAMRFSVLPILYVETLSPAWGQTAYLVQQFAGIHGFAQVGVLSFGFWAVGAGIVGWKAGTIPAWLAALAIVPGLRILPLLSVVGNVEDAPDWLWVVFMLSIPGTMLWVLLLGLWLFRDRAKAGSPAG